MDQTPLFISSNGKPITASILLSTLRSAKADECDILYIHSDLSFGAPNPGLKRSELLARLMDTIGQLGVKTIMFPTFTFSFCNNEIFDRENTRSRMGALTEYARKLPQAVRSSDPLLGPLYAGKRYGAYLARSMESPDQHLYALKNGQNGDIVGFKSHRYLPDGSVQLLLGGLRDDCKGSGLAPLLEHLEFSTLLAAGIKRGVTAVSARNLAIMNLEIAGFGFKVKESLVVLRKMYAT